MTPSDHLEMVTASSVGHAILGLPASLDPISRNADMQQVLRRSRGSQDEGPVALPSAGAPLPLKTRRRMESAFQHDFSHVRVFVGSQAAQAAQQLQAHAFALGADIFFGAGEFAPETPSGDRLLAHELTHVVQADEGRIPHGGGVSDPSDAIEREAYANEDRVLGALSAMGSEGTEQAPTASSVVDHVAHAHGGMPDAVRNTMLSKMGQNRGSRPNAAMAQLHRSALAMGAGVFLRDEDKTASTPAKTPAPKPPENKTETPAEVPAGETKPEAPSSVTLYLAGRRINVPIPAGLIGNSATISLAQTLFPGLDVKKVHLGFDKEWAVTEGSLDGALSLGIRGTTLNVPLVFEVNKGGTVKATANNAALEGSEVATGVVNATIGEDGIAADGTLTFVSDFDIGQAEQVLLRVAAESTVEFATTGANITKLTSPAFKLRYLEGVAEGVGNSLTVAGQGTWANEMFTGNGEITLDETWTFRGAGYDVGLSVDDGGTITGAVTENKLTTLSAKAISATVKKGETDYAVGAFETFEYGESGFSASGDLSLLSPIDVSLGSLTASFSAPEGAKQTFKVKDNRVTEIAGTLNVALKTGDTTVGTGEFTGSYKEPAADAEQGATFVIESAGIELIETLVLGDKEGLHFEIGAASKEAGPAKLTLTTTEAGTLAVGWSNIEASLYGGAKLLANVSSEEGSWDGAAVTGSFSGLLDPNLSVTLFGITATVSSPGPLIASFDAKSGLTVTGTDELSIDLSTLGGDAAGKDDDPQGATWKGWSITWPLIRGDFDFNLNLPSAADGLAAILSWLRGLFGGGEKGSEAGGGDSWLDAFLSRLSGLKSVAGKIGGAIIEFVKWIPTLFSGLNPFPLHLPEIDLSLGLSEVLKKLMALFAGIELSGISFADIKALFAGLKLPGFMDWTRTESINEASGGEGVDITLDATGEFDITLTGTNVPNLTGKGLGAQLKYKGKDLLGFSGVGLEVRNNANDLKLTVTTMKKEGATIVLGPTLGLAVNQGSSFVVEKAAGTPYTFAMEQLSVSLTRGKAPMGTAEFPKVEFTESGPMIGEATLSLQEPLVIGSPTGLHFSLGGVQADGAGTASLTVKASSEGISLSMPGTTTLSCLKGDGSEVASIQAVDAGYDGSKLTGTLSATLTANPPLQVSLLGYTASLSADDKIGVSVGDDGLAFSGKNLKVDFSKPEAGGDKEEGGEGISFGEFDWTAWRVKIPEGLIPEGPVIPKIQFPRDLGIKALLDWLAKKFGPGGPGKEPPKDEEARALGLPKWLVDAFDAFAKLIVGLGKAVQGFMGWLINAFAQLLGSVNFPLFPVKLPELNLLGFLADAFAALMGWLKDIRIQGLSFQDLIDLLKSLKIPWLDRGKKKEEDPAPPGESKAGGKGFNLGLDAKGTFEVQPHGLEDLPTVKGTGLSASLTHKGEAFATLSADLVTFDGPTKTLKADWNMAITNGDVDLGLHTLTLQGGNILSLEWQMGQTPTLGVANLSATLKDKSEDAKEVASASLTNVKLGADGLSADANATVSETFMLTSRTGEYAVVAQKGASMGMTLEAGSIKNAHINGVIDVIKGEETVATCTASLQYDPETGLTGGAVFKVLKDLDLGGGFTIKGKSSRRRSKAPGTTLTVTTANGALSKLTATGGFDYKKPGDDGDLSISGTVSAATIDLATSSVGLAGAAFDVKRGDLAFSGTLDGSYNGQSGAFSASAALKLKKSYTLENGEAKLTLKAGAGFAASLDADGLSAISITNAAFVGTLGPKGASQLKVSGFVNGSYDDGTFKVKASATLDKDATLSAGAKLGVKVGAGATLTVDIHEQGVIIDVANLAMTLTKGKTALLKATITQGSYADGKISCSATVTVPQPTTWSAGQLDVTFVSGTATATVSDNELQSLDVNGLVIDVEWAEKVGLRLAMNRGSFDGETFTGGAVASLTKKFDIGTGPKVSILEGTNLGVDIAANVLTSVSGSLTASISDTQGTELVRGDAAGTYNVGASEFTGTGSMTLTKPEGIRLPASSNPHLRINPGTKVGAKISQNRLTELSGTLDANVTDKEGKDFLSVSLAITAGSLGDDPKFSGSITVKTTEETSFMLGSTEVKLGKGTGGSATMVNNAITALSVNVTLPEIDLLGGALNLAAGTKITADFGEDMAFEGASVASASLRFPGLNPGGTAADAPTLAVQTLMVTRLGESSYDLSFSRGSITNLSLLAGRVKGSAQNLAFSNGELTSGTGTGQFRPHPAVLFTVGMVFAKNEVPEIYIGGPFEVPLLPDATLFEMKKKTLGKFKMKANIRGIPTSASIDLKGSMNLNSKALTVTGTLPKTTIMGPDGMAQDWYTNVAVNDAGVVGAASLAAEGKLAVGDTKAKTEVGVFAKGQGDLKLDVSASGEGMINQLNGAFFGEASLGIKCTAKAAATLKVGLVAQAVGSEKYEKILWEYPIDGTDLFDWEYGKSWSFGDGASAGGAPAATALATVTENDRTEATASYQAQAGVEDANDVAKGKSGGLADMQTKVDMIEVLAAFGNAAINFALMLGDAIPPSAKSIRLVDSFPATYTAFSQLEQAAERAKNNGAKEAMEACGGTIATIGKIVFAHQKLVDDLSVRIGKTVDGVHEMMKMGTSDEMFLAMEMALKDMHSGAVNRTEETIDAVMSGELADGVGEVASDAAGWAGNKAKWVGGKASSAISKLKFW